MESRRHAGWRMLVDRRRATGCAGSSARCSTRTSSSRRTACARCRASTRRHPLDVELDGMTSRARLRAGRVDDRPLRRQLELARPDLVPGQLPARSRRCASTTATSATSFTVEFPTGSGNELTLARGRRRAVRAADRRSSCDDEDGRRPVFGGYELFQTRPGVARPDPVPRVLPRRHRRGPRRLAPDRAGPGSSPT